LRGDGGNRPPVAATTAKSPWGGTATVDAMSIVAAAPERDARRHRTIATREFLE